MNNTEKLLRAFIEAQGFDVEEVHTPLGDTEISDWNNKWRNANTRHIPPKPTASTNYKVTKRGEHIKQVDISTIYKHLSFALENVLHCEPVPPSDVLAICKVLGLTNEKI